MGVIDDLRRDIARALDEAKREALGQPPAAPTAPTPASRDSDGRLVRQSLERTPPPSGPGLSRGATPTGPTMPEFDLGLPAAPLIPPRQDRPTAAARPSAAPAADGTGFTVTPHDIIRAILLGEVLDEPKGRRARRPHPR